MIATDAKSHSEIKRIALKERHSQKEENSPEKKMSRNLKKRMIKTLMWSLVLHVYCSETWTMRKEDIKS